MNIGKQQ